MTDRVILHDQFRTLGGAERVAIEMAREFDAPIYAMRVDEDVVPDDVTVHDLSGRWGGRCMRSHYLVQDAYQMLAWQHQDALYDADTIIVNKTNPAWFVPKDTQTTVWYLHSTPRGLYDQFPANGRGLLTAAIKAAMRTLYSGNRLHPDAWVCNSDLVQRRLETYLGVGRERPRSHVVYPPVDVDSQSRHIAPTGDYYLVLGRLHGHKRVTEAIEAAAETGVQLRIAGEGPQRTALEQFAAAHDAPVTFEGYVSEATKARLLSGAKALLMTARNEDFGIVPIEAMAAGTPVIGVDDGFTRHQILHRRNGLCYPHDADDVGLEDAIEHFEAEGVAWSESRIESLADQFSTTRFRREFRDVVEAAEDQSAVNPSLADVIAEAVSTDTDEEPVVADGGRDA